MVFSQSGFCYKKRAGRVGPLIMRSAVAVGYKNRMDCQTVDSILKSQQLTTDRV